MKRELAWRVFSGEYNDSTLEIKGVGEKTASHIITPLGGNLNRLYIVGVLTDVENVSEGGEFVRAHISDPTGVFTIYSGQFQQEATDQLLNIDVPAFTNTLALLATNMTDKDTAIGNISANLPPGSEGGGTFVKTSNETSEKSLESIEQKDLSKGKASIQRPEGCVPNQNTNTFEVNLRAFLRQVYGYTDEEINVLIEKASESSQNMRLRSIGCRQF